MTNMRNKLYLDLTGSSDPLPPQAAPEAADGYVLSAAGLPEGICADGKDLLFLDTLPVGNGDLPATARGHTQISRLPLAEIARLREAFPECTWVPQVDLIRLETTYHFPTTHYSEGFRTYQPVFPAQSPYRVSDSDTPIGAWLKNAEEFGFETVWLHRSQSAAAGAGLDLELRELVLENWSGHLWLSGGATTLMHVKYLVQEGGLDALIVTPDLACSVGCDQISTALRRGVERPARKPEGQTPTTSICHESRIG